MNWLRLALVVSVCLNILLLVVYASSVWAGFAERRGDLVKQVTLSDSLCHVKGLMRAEYLYFDAGENLILGCLSVDGVVDYVLPRVVGGGVS